MDDYLKKEKEGGKLLFESILNEELKLDREDESVAGKHKSS
jgi:hypothetical protein